LTRGSRERVLGIIGLRAAGVRKAERILEKCTGGGDKSLEWFVGGVVREREREREAFGISGKGDMVLGTWKAVAKKVPPSTQPRARASIFFWVVCVHMVSCCGL